MGIFSRALRLAALPPGVQRSSAVASPLAPKGVLSAVSWSALLDGLDGGMTRAAAMKVPALARARHLIVTTTASLPLHVVTNGAPAAEQPTWISTAPGTSAWHRMLLTADDLFFYGLAVWGVERNEAGAIVAAMRIDPSDYTITPEGTVEIDGRPVSDNEVLVIPGYHEGILSFASDTLRQARDLNQAAASAARTPSPVVELHQTTDAPLPAEEIDKLIAGWAQARRGDNGGVAYTNRAIETKEHSAADSHLMIDGRNAAAVDIARAAGVPAAMIDAVTPGSSLSYQNTQARMQELLTFGVAPMITAIAARLSLDDVVPPGSEIEFDTTAAVGAASAISAPDDGGAAPTPLVTGLDNASI